MPLPYHCCVTAPSPLVLSITHAGRRYDWLPDAKAHGAGGVSSVDSLRLGEDPFVDGLALGAMAAGIPAFVQRAPRLLVDLNRAPDDMAASEIFGPASGFHPSEKGKQGLGVVPTRYHQHALGAVNAVTAQDVAQRVQAYHQPYHHALARHLRAMRAAHPIGPILLLDLHSMPPLAGQNAPHLVIGDRFGACAPSWLTRRVAQQAEQAGLRAQGNQPYAGGYTIQHHAAPDLKVYALQLEFCRSLYLQSNGKRAHTGFRALRSFIRDLALQLEQDLRQRQN